MEKYLKAKYGPEVQVIPFILKEAGDYKCGEKVDILLKIMIYSFNAFFEEIEEKDEDEQSDYFFTLLSKSLSLVLMILNLKILQSWKLNLMRRTMILILKGG